jgi:hypothetical protein
MYPTSISSSESSPNQELMVDPVLAEAELTYERSAIESWLANHCTSPADPLRELRYALADRLYNTSFFFKLL